MAQIGNMTQAEVRSAVMAFMESEPGGWAEPWRVVYGAAAQILGSTPGYHPGAKFDGQVKRALNKLADDGELVKLPRGTHSPRGNYLDTPQYYTRASYQRATAEADAVAASADETRLRWAAVHDRLTHRLRHAGIEVQGKPGEPVQLNLETWERVLTEWAR